ncbi:MAG: hypothetical protein A2W25_11785 [candidate division Zixibacteria bacterium RBG_16_53_22]|nr:MAG: hypothetical protein A2W25_11785 [candidate division Zixibacteria bacterium RBG_16_53_22]
MANQRQFSDEYIDQLRIYYIENNITIKALALASETLFGMAIEEENLRFISKKDRWSVQKSRHLMGKEGLPIDQADELDDMKRLLYDAINDADEPPNAKELPGLIKAYMEISNAMAASGVAGSAKSSRQQAIEIAREVLGADHRQR